MNIEPVLYWIREREAIRLRKKANDIPPFTTDPILSKYRFCNVRREDDLGTIWIRENIREPFAEHPNLWLMLCLARQINWPDTMAEMIDAKAWPIDGYPRNKMVKLLAARKARGDKLFTGAYMISASGKPGEIKHEYVIDTVVGELWKHRDEAERRPAKPLLQGAHQWLSQFNGWGPFMAYQAVVDMRFTSLLNTAPDIDTWAAAGPGTIRGLNRVHDRPVTGSLSQTKAIEEIRQLCRELRGGRTGIEFDFSDVPNILCEVDKYLRVQTGEGKPRALYVPGRGS